MRCTFRRRETMPSCAVRLVLLKLLPVQLTLLVLPKHVEAAALLSKAPAPGPGGSRLRGSGGLLAGEDAASLRRWHLSLQDLSVSSEEKVAAYSEQAFNRIPYANASLDGKEFGCLGCNAGLFQTYIAQRARALQRPVGSQTPAVQKQNEQREANQVETPATARGQKHPNAPGYDRWHDSAAKADALLALAATGENGTAEDLENVPQVSTYSLSFQELTALRPRLQKLWRERRVVMGISGVLGERMDFVDTLTDLARQSPALSAPDCDLIGLPRCDSLFSGLRTASAGRLRKHLERQFGHDFLAAHSYSPNASESHNKNNVRSLLLALKGNYSFYRQTCLGDALDTRQCQNTQSALLGQVACSENDDSRESDCVYAELRACSRCSGEEPFFEYSRFHGPLALFGTAEHRNSVMGQCEEFSRAGHALLSSLGYETRYVLDFTDHVWLEVRLPRGVDGTWMHADPSEGVLDSPLMYESGWGKNLTMIFAFTPTTIEHVTRRYTAKYEETVSRRGIGDEPLSHVVRAANDRLRFEVPIRKWGYTSAADGDGSSALAAAAAPRRSAERTPEEVALWRHFEDAR